MRPLFLAAARPMKVEWKIRPYFGVFPLVFSALDLGNKLQYATHWNTAKWNTTQDATATRALIYCNYLSEPWAAAQTGGG